MYTNMERNRMHHSMRIPRVHWTFPQCSLILLVVFHMNFASSAAAGQDPSDPSDILLKFKESLKDSNNALKNWKKPISPCTRRRANWDGVICSGNQEIVGLQLENKGLSGEINVDMLSQLPDLITMSIMNNSFEGSLPEMRKLVNIKTVYFSHNKFSGEIPSDWFEGMKSLKKLHLANNQFKGEIPKSLTTLDKLTELHLERNKFSGHIPVFPQTRLKDFNVSNNHLDGEIPQIFKDLNAASFAENDGLCGHPLNECSRPTNIKRKKSNSVSTALVVIIVLVAVVAILAAICFLMARRRNRMSQYSSSVEAPPASSSVNNNRSTAAAVPREPDQVSNHSSSSSKGSGRKKADKAADSLKLSFVRDDRERFDMQDLLKASAEVLGSGCFGSSYKAALLTGPVMVVKRYKQMNNVGREDFNEHMRRLGRLKHPNLLPLVAYYYKKEEKLLITDNVPNGSLAVRLHGHQTLGQASLDWPTRLKIVKGVAQGLRYLYSELPSLVAPHGHLKSSNVLLNESLEPLVTDYGLIPVVNQEHAHTLMVAYKSPEYVATKRITKKTDVWSLGVLILEILTGKLPTNFLQHGKGSEEDLASWVNSVPREEWFGQVFDREMGASKTCEGEMLKLLNIGLECCEGDVEKRWDLREAVERIQGLKERDSTGGGADSSGGGGADEEFLSTCASEGEITKMAG